jgi:hypothetical protein
MDDSDERYSEGRDKLGYVSPQLARVGELSHLTAVDADAGTPPPPLPD